jgi:sigma54-dependent transcription regulator
VQRRYPHVENVAAFRLGVVAALRSRCTPIPDIGPDELYWLTTGDLQRSAAREVNAFVLASVGELDLRTQAVAVNYPLESQDVRLIAASREGLHKRVIAGTFREDLYDRLNVIHLAVPPLRRRREDIPTLVQHLLRYQSEARNRTPDVSPAAMERLVESDWPGNVRQIAEIVAQFVARGAATIDAHHLPKDIFEIRPETTEMFG